MNFSNASSAISKKLSYYGFTGSASELARIIEETTTISFERAERFMWNELQLTRAEITELCEVFFFPPELLSCLAVPTSPEVIEKALDEKGEFRTWDCNICAEAIETDDPAERCFKLLGHNCCAEQSEFVKALGPKLARIAVALQDFEMLSQDALAALCGLSRDEMSKLAEIASDTAGFMVYLQDEGKYQMDANLV